MGHKSKSRSYIKTQMGPRHQQERPASSSPLLEPSPGERQNPLLPACVQERYRLRVSYTETDTRCNYIHSFILITPESDYIFNLAIFFKKLRCFNGSISDGYATTHQLGS